MISSVVFDGLGRISSLKDPNQNAKKGAASYTYTYNGKGLLETETNAIGNQVKYKYNSALLLEQMTDSAEETTSLSMTA